MIENGQFSKSNFPTNFQAENYFDLIDWNLSFITSPSIINDISDEELRQLVEVVPVPVPKYPCHNQVVERTVKEVTRVSSKVFGHRAR